MLQEKAGETAGKIWTVLNEKGAMTLKQIKKAAKINEKDFYLGLGWLLREDKLTIDEESSEATFELK
ncbi:MAG: winged helix-turn-helix domain-containing protein [Prevotellaceae bacterium]|jgi:hypothetical protein|nr:winged helix-turn-helix domain-containing protein [Prevotellaceae bacterium]MDD7376293.1 winged helix-turn-helix domain-containing protein [Prevotellaceae bacterium]